MLAFVACGGGGEHDELGPDAGSGPQQKPQHVCATVGDDLRDPGPAGSLDGVYTEAFASDLDAKPKCFRASGLDPNDNSVAASFVKVDHEKVTLYRRVYADPILCTNGSFDAGGTIEIVSEQAWRGCGPTYTTAAGTFQQIVELARLTDGSLYRFYSFAGTGSANAKWDTLIRATVHSSNPFDEPPADISFIQWRRPR